MSRPAVAFILAIGLWLPATAQSPASPARLERIAEAGKLWTAVKYFHPYLAYRQIDWDQALLAALPRIERAQSPAEYAAAIQFMLGVLGDPATRLLPPNPPAVAEATLTRTLDDGTLVVTLNPATITAAVNGHLASQIAQAKAVVFDLRRQEAWAGPESSTVGLLFVAARLNNELASGTLKSPGHRSRIHSGLAAPWNGGSVYYHSAFYVRDGAVIEGAPGAVEKPLVFLVDRSSSLPPIAVALQAAGKAKIVAAGGATDAALVEKSLISLPDGVRVELRTTELVHEDGTTGLTPDSTVGESEDALAAALRVARAPMTSQATARPKLPPYGVPRREEAYSQPEYPDRAHRMLAAFRIWAAIEYFFAYRSLMDDDWDRVLVDTLAELERTSDAREYALAIARMLTFTKDSHVTLAGSRTMDEFLGTARPPVETRMIEGLPVVTFAEEGLGLAPGDVVTTVDGEDAGGRIERLGRYFAASTPQSLERKVMQYFLSGDFESTATLTIRDAQGKTRQVSVTRAERLAAWPRLGAVVQILEGNVGYVDLARLPRSEVGAMFEKLKDTEAIIFDMRGYPQGTAWLIASRLTDRKQVVAARFRRPLAIGPPGVSGDVTNTSAEWNFVQHIPDSNGWKYHGRTVMLIDERAQSQAEHAGLFLEAANGTKFVGSPTAGANGDVTRIAIPGGITVSFSGHDVRHADGRQLQRVGLVPDVAVKPTISGVRAGRDEVLEKALEYLGVGGAKLSGVGEAR